MDSILEHEPSNFQQITNIYITDNITLELILNVYVLKVFAFFVVLSFHLLLLKSKIKSRIFLW